MVVVGMVMVVVEMVIMVGRRDSNHDDNSNRVRQVVLMGMLEMVEVVGKGNIKLTIQAF